VRSAVVVLLLLAGVGAAPAEEVDPSAVAEGWRQRLDGLRFTAQVRMVVSLEGRDEERRLRVWRDDVDGSRERLYARFEAPPVLRDLAILYIENADRLNDYFIYQPGTGRIRRISETMASEDIYGIDLEFLGFGVAQDTATSVESAEVTELDGVRTVRIVERALEKNPRFDERVSWIDPETLVPLRMVHYRSGNERLVARTEAVAAVDPVATPRRTVFRRPRDREVVTMVVDEIDYRSPIPRDVFSTLSLLK